MQKIAKTRYMKWIEGAANKNERDRRIQKLMDKSQDHILKEKDTPRIKDQFKSGKRMQYSRLLGGPKLNDEYFDHTIGDTKYARKNIKNYVAAKHNSNTGSIKDMTEKHEKNIAKFQEFKARQKAEAAERIAKKKAEILARKHARIQAGPTPFKKLQEAQDLAKNKAQLPTRKTLPSNAKMGLGLGAGALALGAGALAYNKVKKKKEIEKKAMEG